MALIKRKKVKKDKTKTKEKKNFIFTIGMKKRLFTLFAGVICILLFFVVRLSYIELKSGEKYEKIVLSQQEYGSTSIPFRRGDIVDRHGTVLASSSDVYNVILDCTLVLSKEEYLEPTVKALVSNFNVDEAELRDYITSNPKSQYYVVKKGLEYSAIQQLQNTLNDEEKSKNIKGVWFEKEYVRNYPYATLASNVIGFTTAGNVGIEGLENSYNDVLNGTDGREYGYLDSDSTYEVYVKDAINGQTVVSTIDINLQSIVETKIQEMLDGYKTADEMGAQHVGVILMDPNTCEILAMADYPNYSLNDPWDISAYYSAEEQEEMTDDEKLEVLNGIWQDFCVTYTYEPGSTAKPFTVACGLDTGTLTPEMEFVCDGSEYIDGFKIKCIKTTGHGTEDVEMALVNSCNDALMQMSYLIGAENFSKYQQLFNFGLKTNIDLPGEARTDTLIYPKDQLYTINLATNAFGQNFNVTMVQLATAYCSIVNGGNYYRPHIVNKIEDENGNTVKNIEPVLLKKVCSEETSELVRSYLSHVVDDGTGSKAKVDGYSMCGKTGTAEKFDLETGQRLSDAHVVSFIGSIPADDPQLVCYVVIDEPNVSYDADSKYAQFLAREIFEYALPYLNIFPDEAKIGTNANRNTLNNKTGTETFDDPEDLYPYTLDVATVKSAYRENSSITSYEITAMEDYTGDSITIEDGSTTSSSSSSKKQQVQYPSEVPGTAD